jgi:hypothetical protein
MRKVVSCDGSIKNRGLNGSHGLYSYEHKYVMYSPMNIRATTEVGKGRRYISVSPFLHTGFSLSQAEIE